MNKQFFLLSLLSLALLQACGGGGDGGGSAFVVPPGGGDSTPTPTATDEGSVSAPFARTDASRYMLVDAGSQSMGRLTESTQAESGAMTQLNDNTLTGTTATKNIAGDASFAIGRWVSGTVTTRSGAATLIGDDARSHHYVAYNVLAALPDTGALACGADSAFTAPTLTSSTGAKTGSASGAATVDFSADGASITGAIEVSVGDVHASVTLPGTVTSPSGMTFSGAYLSNGAGAGLAIADAGDGNYALIVPFSAVLNGARYMGMARLGCTAS